MRIVNAKNIKLCLPTSWDIGGGWGRNVWLRGWLGSTTGTDMLEKIRTLCLCGDSNRRPYIIPQPSRYAASGAPSPAVNVNLKHFQKQSIYTHTHICVCVYIYTYIYIYIYTHTKVYIIRVMRRSLPKRRTIRSVVCAEIYAGWHQQP